MNKIKVKTVLILLKLIVVFIGVFIEETNGQQIRKGGTKLVKGQINYIGIIKEWEANSSRTRPDQIRIDKKDKDIIWFTQPNNNSIGRFNYRTNSMIEYKASKEYRPDGLVLDKEGNLWFGEQSAGTLGKFEPKTKTFRHYKVPYEDANPAIPTIDKEGMIWVSDHKNNTIIRFNPKTQRFGIIGLPVNISWVVDLKEDKAGRIWYTCYGSDRLGYISGDRKHLIEYQFPMKGLGPAFMALDSEENIWMTLWKSNKLAHFDVKAKKFTLYQILVRNPGPAAIAYSKKDDRLYFSTSHLNSIVMLDLKKPSIFHIFKIPTKRSGQKDGLVADSNGVIWFTEFDKNKIGRLKVYKRENISDGDFSNYTISKKARVKKIVFKGGVKTKRYKVFWNE